MSMPLEEARIELQAMKDTFEEYEPGGSRGQMALKVALSALRPVSREQVERIRGTWEPFGGKYLTRKKCSRCGWDGQEHIKFYSWCPNCGSPMTDEAVQMVMERLEALHGE